MRRPPVLKKDVDNFLAVTGAGHEFFSDCGLHNVLFEYLSLNVLFLTNRDHSGVVLAFNGTLDNSREKLATLSRHVLGTFHFTDSGWHFPRGSRICFGVDNRKLNRAAFGVRWNTNFSPIFGDVKHIHEARDTNS